MFRYLRALVEGVLFTSIGSRYKYDKEWDRQLSELIKSKKMVGYDNYTAKFDIGDGYHLEVWIALKFYSYGYAYLVSRTDGDSTILSNKARVFRPSIKTMLALDDYVKEFSKKPAVTDYLKDNWGL